MDGASRIKIKIGQHEFEAEGPAEIVREQFESFKQMVAAAPIQPQPLTQNSPEIPDTSDTIVAPATDMPIDANSLGKIMRKAGRVVSLIIRPKSIEEALLLILLGQRHLRGMEVITGGEVMAGIKDTGGVSVTRVDRLLEKMGRDGDLIVAGSRRSKTYRFTNAGLNKAEKMAAEWLTTVA